eukprot:6477693-Amphidinium_carterae.1
MGFRVNWYKKSIFDPLFKRVRFDSGVFRSPRFSFLDPPPSETFTPPPQTKKVPQRQKRLSLKNMLDTRTLNKLLIRISKGHRKRRAIFCIEM